MGAVRLFVCSIVMPPFLVCRESISERHGESDHQHHQGRLNRQSRSDKRDGLPGKQKTALCLPDDLADSGRLSCGEGQSSSHFLPLCISERVIFGKMRVGFSPCHFLAVFLSIFFDKYKNAAHLCGVFAVHLFSQHILVETTELESVTSCV